MQIRLPNPFMAKVYVCPRYSVNTPKKPTPPPARPAQVASPYQPFVYRGHANSSRNSFNARGLWAPAPLDQHRRILHPLACPLRLFSQGPQAQTAHDGMTPSRFTFTIN